MDPGAKLARHSLHRVFGLRGCAAVEFAIASGIFELPARAPELGNLSTDYVLSVLLCLCLREQLVRLVRLVQDELVRKIPSRDHLKAPDQAKRSRLRFLPAVLLTGALLLPA